MYFFTSQDNKHDVTTYVVLKLEKNSVQINDLAPDTAYLVKVQAFSSDGRSGVPSGEEQFETSPEGTQQNHTRRSLWVFVFKMRVFDVRFIFLAGQLNKTAVILAAAVGGAIVLILVIVILFLRRR